MLSATERAGRLLRKGRSQRQMAEGDRFAEDHRQCETVIGRSVLCDEAISSFHSQTE